MIFTSLVAQALQLRENQVEHTIELLESGCTIPFISRYSKEATGSLDEVRKARHSRAVLPVILVLTVVFFFPVCGTNQFRHPHACLAQPVVCTAPYFHDAQVKSIVTFMHTLEGKSPYFVNK